MQTGTVLWYRHSMAERRSSWHKRCPLCKINKELCFCSEIKIFDIQSRLQVLIHRKEKFLPSNTANLLARNFPNNIKMLTQGEPDPNKRQEFKFTDGHYPLFLYPDENAIELNQKLLNDIASPIELIIPDGTWRQARKMKRRIPNLSSVISVKLTGDFQSSYSLRKQKYDNGLCTYEAAAKALGIIEGKELEKKMLKQFEVMNNRFKASRPY